MLAIVVDFTNIPAGRTALSTSNRRIIRRLYATDINLDSPIHRQSNQDHKSQTVIPGHPDSESSLLDAIGHQDGPLSTPVREALDEFEHNLSSLKSQVEAVSAAQNGGAIPQPTPYLQRKNEIPPAPYESLEEMEEVRQAQLEMRSKGSNMSDLYFPSTIVDRPPMASEVSLEQLLANQCHLGHATALWHPGNSSYIFGIRHGIHIISLDITLSYLRRAAKVIQEVAKRGGIILFVGTRKGQRDIVVKSAIRGGAYYIFQRWIPGTLTNGQQILGNAARKVVNIYDDEVESYRELVSGHNASVLMPDLVVMLNPIENQVCLHECGTFNIPTVGIVDTDVNPAWVTYPIPANDDSLRSVALISGVLSNAAALGNQQRTEAAKEGVIHYATNKVQKYLQLAQSLQGMVARSKERDDE